MAVHIYLSKTEPGKYEIWRDQAPTGEVVGIHFIRQKLLTRKQFQEFIRQENAIFYIDGQRWRSRNYKRKLKKSSNLPSDEKPRKY
jgi:hypothetical protein